MKNTKTKETREDILKGIKKALEKNLKTQSVNTHAC